MKPQLKLITTTAAILLTAAVMLLVWFHLEKKRANNPAPSGQVKSAQASEPGMPNMAPLDKAAYDQKLKEIANNPVNNAGTTDTATPQLWPVKTVYPNGGAILPFNRIVAYYGNLYSKNMGVLGEYPEDQMLQKLQGEVQKWQQADPTTPVIPALHYIAVVARGTPGPDGKYRTRMPDSQINKVLAMAQKINGLVFLDIQLGQSNIQTELPLLEKYLKMPQVHLGIDPEFAMSPGNSTSSIPGRAIGTLDAKDINFAANFLAQVVKENNLPPKILIVHRFTQKMVTNYQQITPLPEVQIIMNMDGFGGAPNKLNTYRQFIYKEPVQFTGFKLFYKNDVKKPGSHLLSPNDLLKLTPAPVYIQFQ